MEILQDTEQEEILSAVNEEKMTLLDVGTKILAAAYEYAGTPIPDWLKTRRLPQNQMESSFVDKYSNKIVDASDVFSCKRE
jgi:hypothetical protein